MVRHVSTGIDALLLYKSFAGLDTLVPRVVKFCVTSTSAVFEPRTSATAATPFARFRDGAASGAYGNGDRRCRVCWGLYVALAKTKGGKSLTAIV